MPAPRSRILALNRGSSTLKAALYEMGDTSGDPQLVLTAKTSQSSPSRVRVQITEYDGTSRFDGDANLADDGDLKFVLDWLTKHEDLENLAAIGHRLVHGGSMFTEPQRIDADTLGELDRLLAFDPDHLPASLAGIRLVQKNFPNIPQVACFDTAFHSKMPINATMYAIPRRFYEAGLRRYGFHGLSYEYIVRELEQLDPVASRRERVIIAHLGSGASIAAIQKGQSIDTSMGFTPLEGLVMATRSGDIDPGAVLFLINQRGGTSPDHAKDGQVSSDQINKLLNKESGLLGLSETSSDMRELLEQSARDERAAEAVDLFCYRVKKYIGSYAAALGGFDTLVFTAGIGERAAAVRAQICSGLEFLGIQIDPSRNKDNASIISAPESRITVRVIPTNEELTIVHHVRAVLGVNVATYPAR